MAKPHRWRVVGRLPVSLVRRVCDCGCKGQMIQVVGDDGRAIALRFPFGGSSGATLKKTSNAIAIGRELLAVWERIKSRVA